MSKACFVKLTSCVALLLPTALAVFPPALIPPTVEAIYDELVKDFKHDVTDDAKKAGETPQADWGSS